MNDGDTFFNVGDEVLVKKTHEKGIITAVVSVLGKGNNLYEVNFENKKRLYAEDYLELVKLKNNDKDNIINDEKIQEKITKKIINIIETLKLRDSLNIEDILFNACTLQRYLATRMTNEQKEEILTNDFLSNELYEGLFNCDNNYITNCFVFSTILKQVGVEVLNVALKDEEGNFYMNNLVLLGKFYYYFDVNLERELFLEEKNNKNYNLLCVALGSKSYDEYFKPFKIISFENENIDLPKNIAKDNYDQKEIKKIEVI